MSTDIQKFTPKKHSLKSGEILMVRIPEEKDAESMISYLNKVGGESDNLLFGENEFHLTPEEEASYINKLHDLSGTLMIIGIIGSDIVSIAQISSFTRKRIAHNAEIALSVKKEHWHKGIGYLMMEELLSFARSTKTIRNISLGVREDNLNAIKLYEKLGFQKTGIHTDYFYIHGKYFNEILMDLRLT